jgi:hypothetical protein
VTEFNTIHIKLNIFDTVYRNCNKIYSEFQVCLDKTIAWPAVLKIFQTAAVTARLLLCKKQSEIQSKFCYSFCRLQAHYGSSVMSRNERTGDEVSARPSEGGATLTWYRESTCLPTTVAVHYSLPFGSTSIL